MELLKTREPGVFVLEGAVAVDKVGGVFVVFGEASLKATADYAKKRGRPAGKRGRPKGSKNKPKEAPKKAPKTPKKARKTAKITKAKLAKQVAAPAAVA
jgi:hypothetical protein